MKELILKIAKEYNIRIVCSPLNETGWFDMGDKTIYLGEFENEEFLLLTFFHEMGHVLDKSYCYSNKYDEENAAWLIAYKLANKYNIKFSNDAINYGLKCLKTYEKYKYMSDYHFV